MELEQTPTPVAPSSPAPSPVVARWRWWVHLALIGLYPAIIIGYGQLKYGGQRKEAALPNTVSGLLLVAVLELTMFGLVFAVGWLFSRASMDQLMLRWRRSFFSVALGVGYSVALRLMITVFVITFLLGHLILMGGLTSSKNSGKATEQLAKKMSPKTDVLLDAKTLVKNPVYFVLMLTLISFVVAGLREELWRAGVLAGIAALFPQWYDRLWGKMLAVGLVGVVFGLGHLPQGWGAAGLTTLLGWGLGGIMVFHRSVWIAALAHGFFDATTFVMMYLIVRYLPGQVPGM